MWDCMEISHTFDAPGSGKQDTVKSSPQGSMSHARFFCTFASLFAALVLVYASVFYVPAYLNVQKTLGLSTQDGKLPNQSALSDANRMNNYARLFTLRRGYFRAGQTLRLDHDLPPGTTMVVSISRCSAPPVIEAFYCMNIEGHQIKITDPGPGTRTFTMQKPGFYYFDETVYNKLRDSDPSFEVVWTRN